MMEVKNLSVRYGGNIAAKGISFVLEPGQWLMLVGPNGAGKTSLVKAIAGTVPYTGDVLWHGREARRFSGEEWAKHIGVLSQRQGLEYGFSVEEILEMGRYAYRKGWFPGRDEEGERLMDQMLEATGLVEVRKRNALTLSGGQWQRTLLAKVFVQNPSVLVLDEPANHLDLLYQKQLFDLIQSWLKDGERAVISVVHDLSLARKYGTHALLMAEGACAGQGSIEKVFVREYLEAAYRMDIFDWMGELLRQWE